MEEDKLLQERKEKIANFLKEKYDWIVYLLLALVTYIAIYIRSLNIPGLRDITTGGWTLAQDLDPYLFLRWAKYIVANGSLMTLDMMRYVPLGFNTSDELILQPYLIAWFHKLAVLFGSTSVEQSAVIYPVFMFALTVIAFFLLVRKIFQDGLGEFKAGLIAVSSALFLSLIPSLLPRTIAGIPEKESSGFLFLFLAFYFFLCAWKSDKLSKQLTFALLSGIATAMMAMVWGGFIYIYLVIAMSVLMAFIFGHLNKDKIYSYALFIISSFAIMNLFSTRYTLSNLLVSTTTLIPLAILGLLIVHLILTETSLKKYLKLGFLAEIPEPITTLAVAIILGYLFSIIFFGFSYVPDKLSDIAKPLITPVTDRLGVTVAENRQPFFSEWANSFGPVMNGIPIFFWLFFLGSIYLASFMLRVLDKKNRIIVTAGYSFFILALIFSRYSSSSTFNGTNPQSILFYALGFLVLMFCLSREGVTNQKLLQIYNWTSLIILVLFGFVFFAPSFFSTALFIYPTALATIVFLAISIFGISKQEKLREIDFGILLLFSLFFLSLISARGSVRTIMVLVPAASVVAVYFAFALFNDIKKMKADYKLFGWIALAIIVLGLVFAAFQFYQQSAFMAENNVKIPLPGNQMSLDLIYSQQWQKAMAWVRESTPTNSVFAHWWDYGYWVQTLGERATVLDGGNSIAYWDYLMGRYALTGTSDQDSLEFLYTHNTTHLLIDSTDIGKYTAFSSIGSNPEYDRYAFINAYSRSDADTRESKNSTLFAYYPGTKGTIVPLDSDITYTFNGSQVIFPAGRAGVIGFILEKNETGYMQPSVALYYQNTQYPPVPLRYAYLGSKLVDFGTGINSGIFMMPSATQTGVNPDAVLLFLSDRTVKSQLAKLYLYNENNPYFRLAHSEDDMIVSQLKAQNYTRSDFVYFAGSVRGPIRIWQINYPAGMRVNQTELQDYYPDPRLKVAR